MSVIFLLQIADQASASIWWNIQYYHHIYHILFYIYIPNLSIVRYNLALGLKPNVLYSFLYFRVK